MTLAPSLSVAVVHDDNVFIRADGVTGPVADTFVRYTPGLTLDYAGDVLKLTGNYSQDGERYNDNKQLDSNAARRNANLAARWILTDRFSFDLGGAYQNTPTPGELNFLTLPGVTGAGFELGRLRAKAYSANTGVHYRFSPTFDSGLTYTASKSEAQTVPEVETRETNLDFTKNLSARTALLFGHSYREYQFANADTVETNTPTVGVSYDWSRTTNLTVEAGPRFIGDDVKPNIVANLRHDLPAGQFSIGYTRSDTVLTGINDRVETDFLDASYTRNVGRAWSFGFRPSYGRLRSGGSDARVTRADLDARYRFTNYFSIYAMYQYTRQEDNFAGVFDRVIPRNVASIGISFEYPIRRQRETSVPR